jgi:glycosyltransferase involved in cell wall biosynthesis
MGMRAQKMQIQKAALENKKKILILIEWFAPGYKAGGPIQSCINMCRALQGHYEVFVLTTDTDHGETTPYPGILTNQWLPFNAEGVNIWYAPKSSFTKGEMAAVLHQLQPDFVYLNLLFSPLFVLYPLWLKLNGKIRGKVILCPRGSLYDSAISLKWYKKKPMLQLYKWLGVHKKINFHATNAREQEAIEKYFPGSQILIADNLPDSNQQVFETSFKETGSLNCIFIARIVPIKNLLYLLQVLQQVKATICLDIVGPVENEPYWQLCLEAIRQLPLHIKVNYLGAKPQAELEVLIKQQHLFILPTTGENFGHAIFESLRCGRPVLISDQTPWLQLANQQAGWDLPLSAPDQFAEVIEHLAAANQAQFDTYAKAAWQYANHFIENSVAQQQYFKLFT